MNDRRMLVVTGNRACLIEYDGTQASETWMYGALIEAIEETDPRPTLVINGGAKGPDVTSTVIAHRNGIEWREFRLNGFVYGHSGPTSRWRDAEGLAKHPFERNRALVAAAVKARDEGWHVRVLALIAPWTKTYGAQHTAAQAAHFGLEVTRLECPREYGVQTDAT